jgi:hypothetical protein
MSTSKSIIETPYGPIPKSDEPLKRKARLLQGYYRQEKLHQPMGTGPNNNSTQPYCNMLVDGKNTGANFLKPEIFEYAKFRCADKRIVETIEAFRLFNNMLSSQPMCFNLFVPLRSAVRRGDALVLKAFQQVFPQFNIDRLVNIEIEFIPVPIDEYTNDKSAFDAFVELRTKDGKKGCIAIETKYVDSLGTNNPSNMSTKFSVATDIGCFTEDGLKRIETECPQIFRNFLLVEKYRLRHGFEYSHSIVLALQEDKEADKEIDEFKNLLRPEFQSKITKTSLEEFVDAIHKHCPKNEKQWIERFRDRYLDMKSAERLVEACLASIVSDIGRRAVVNSVVAAE